MTPERELRERFDSMDVANIRGAIKEAREFGKDSAVVPCSILEKLLAAAPRAADLTVQTGGVSGRILPPLPSHLPDEWEMTAALMQNDQLEQLLNAHWKRGENPASNVKIPELAESIAKLIYQSFKLAPRAAGGQQEASLTLKQILDVLYTGRTMVNFNHVPSVTRAIDWLSQDFRDALAAAEPQVEERGKT